MSGNKKKIRKRSKNLTLSVLRKGWVNIMRKSHLKFMQKEKEINVVKFQMFFKKTMLHEKTLPEKNRQKAQKMTVQSSQAKTTIIYPRHRKKLREQKMAENNSKLLLLGKFNFDPEEILDNCYYST